MRAFMAFLLLLAFNLGYAETIKIKGLEVNAKTGEVKEVFEEISKEEYQKRLEETKKAEEERKRRELIEKKKREILERQAIQELIKEGKLNFGKTK